MKTILKGLSFAYLVLIFTDAAFSQVKSDHDKSVDFTQFKTYRLEGWEKNSDQILTAFDKERIETALKNELALRGMNPDASNPQAAITLFIVVNQKTSTTAYTTYTGGMGYGYGRWGWGMGAGMGSSTTSFSEDDYLEGTFVVSMHETSGKNLVWQGVITSVVKEKPEKREKSIPKKMKKLFKSYPVKPMQ